MSDIKSRVIKSYSWLTTGFKIDGTLKHKALSNCPDCLGDGRIIITFTRQREPRKGQTDYDVIACLCTGKKSRAIRSDDFMSREDRRVEYDHMTDRMNEMEEKIKME